MVIESVSGIRREGKRKEGESRQLSWSGGLGCYVDRFSQTLPTGDPLNLGSADDQLA